MNMPVRWTAKAEKSFTDIIAHLETNWSEKEVRKFVRKTQDVLKQIAVFPLMYEASERGPACGKVLLPSNVHCSTK